MPSTFVEGPIEIQNWDERERRRFVNVVNGQIKGERTKDYLLVRCQRTGTIRHNNMVFNTTTLGLSQNRITCTALHFRQPGQ